MTKKHEKKGKSKKSDKKSKIKRKKVQEVYGEIKLEGPKLDEFYIHLNKLINTSLDQSEFDTFILDNAPHFRHNGTKTKNIRLLIDVNSGSGNLDRSNIEVRVVRIEMQ